MTIAVSQSSINNQHQELEYARQQRLAATLIYLVREFKQQKAELACLKEELETFTTTLSEIKSKRQRLCDQNFSGSDHLKPTHKKYWKRQQELQQSKLDCKSRIMAYRRDLIVLAKKINDIRSTLSN